MKVDVKIRNDSDNLGVLSLVGPRAGQLMTRISDSKVGSFVTTSFFLPFICPTHL